MDVPARYISFSKEDRAGLSSEPTRVESSQSRTAMTRGSVGWNI